MKASLRSFAFACVAFASAMLPTAAIAGSKALALKVSGSIATAPAWQNDANAPITELSFTFSGIAGDSANVAVVSSTASAKLVNATSYPASISLTRPKSCSIGGSNVADADVIFAVGASDMASDGSFSITSNALQSFSMKFAAAGGYGTLSGAVDCATAGSMTYTY